ncbi:MULTISPECIES: DUF2812 domain-containing protein [unclassified Viridibacillus]|uniref:DUF2812 domain-containing protein n=1 Tax=unclassified Viridibacillus TaxID=2617942 RepID=UPI00096D4482|nr:MULTISPECIES: DUF2812 domain-containing protein [unclassified Viridibacillus]OMC85390.1 hypothetical protein BK130_01055 [Viridibacillus sp. FSL H8-0123]OMC87332.1 hypothetical protein BK128_07835 [Viridibacillus sp. FSL H7-0596]
MKGAYNCFWDFEKEEQWLNSQSKKGLQLKKVNYFRYTFEEDATVNYNYRLEKLKDKTNHRDNKEYIEFLQDSGIEHVDTYFGWVYLRKDASEEPFELYTDTASKMAHYNRIIAIPSAIIVFNVLIFFINLFLSKESDVTDFIIGINLGMAVTLFTFILYTFNKIRKLKKSQILFHI